MAAVVATDEWPRRSLTVAMSTPFSSRREAWLWRTVWSDAPLGSFSDRQSLETVPDTESGFSGVPSGLAKIRSRSLRYSGPNCRRYSSWRSRWRARTAGIVGGNSILRGFSDFVLLKISPARVCESDRSTKAAPSRMSVHRNAKTSPRRHPVAVAISRNVPRHHGPTAHSTMWSCSAGSSASPARFFTFGRSLWVTGFTVTNPHLIARRYAEDTNPAMVRTVFGDIGRGALVLRVWPPHFSNRTHSLLRCSGVIAAMSIASSSGARYTIIS